MTIQLLPSPKEISIRAGTFTLDGATQIVIAAGAGADVFRAARQLQAEIANRAGFRPAILKAYCPPSAENRILLVCGEEQAAAFGVDPLRVDAPQATASQAYALSVESSGALLYAETPTGLFYAVQTLRQLVRLHGPSVPALIIRDWPTMPYRGLMLDVSRGKVHTLDTLAQVVETLSHYKLNVL